jgi:putative AdoMet-dependent methyltransferase
MGREFIDLFDGWASSYDETVSGNDEEYRAVFQNYEAILQEVADRAGSSVLEFGVGTGNLTEKLLERGLDVIGIEPSEQMRVKAKEKFPALNISDGDFLHFSINKQSVNTIVSTYAFHHLTDDEKDEAIRSYSQLLPVNGKIIFADTLYEDESAKLAIIQEARNKGYDNLVHDLETEYYTLKDTMERMFASHHFKASFTQLNTFVWLIEAVRME